MGSTFGQALRVSIFGQSHSPAVGCVVHGLPVGFKVDEEELSRFMARRAPGRNRFSTPRRETDAVRIVSGLNERGETCGAPLAALIENTNTRSSDYDELRRIPRPSHADLTAHLKWQGHQDVSGGGHFSARLTAPLCVAGGIALQLLASRGIRIAAHVERIGAVSDERLQTLDNSLTGSEMLAQQLAYLQEHAHDPIVCLSPEAAHHMAHAIDRAREDQDSVGGTVECVACNMPAGIGGPRYDGVQATIARIVFSLPAVRALEFGAGFSLAHMRGSEANDPYELRDGQVVPTTNNSGGTLGGITTGAPIAFRMAVKPTPSIGRAQSSVDLTTCQQAELSVRGRHDPCVAARAVPIAEAAMAVALLDCWLSAPDAQHSPWNQTTSDVRKG